MKELSTEEKAKRYEEALDNAKVVYKTIRKDLKPVIEQIFPELKESDDDRIRKAIICGMNALKKGNRIYFAGIYIDDILAWLEKQDKSNSQVILPQFTFDDILALQCCMETVKKVQEDKDLYEKLNELHSRLYDAYHLEKQGKQKSVWHNEGEEPQKDSLILLIMQSGIPVVAKIIEPHHTFTNGERWAYIDDLVEEQDKQKSVDKIEPKFNMADWIVMSNGKAYQVISVNEYFDEYILTGCDGRAIKRSIQETDKSASIFTIQDAKNGDVLAGKIDGDSYILIYKQIKDGWIETYGHYYDSVDRFCVPSQLFCREVKGTFRPTTKEQKEFLFQKMRKAGYEWDKDKKELIKL